MASIKEMDLNPDTYIGLKLPMKKDNILDFSSTMTIYEQSEYNIKNLLLTQLGVRVMQPNFGSDLRRLCFEQNDDSLLETIEAEIRERVDFWLPYINIKNVELFTDDGNRNKIFIKLTYSVTFEDTNEKQILINFESRN